MVLMCGGLDLLQIDYYNLYENYFLLFGIVMLIIDMFFIGFLLKWMLNQDISLLYQYVLCYLENVLWIDYIWVVVFGFCFGVNIVVCLGYLELQWLKVVVCLGLVVYGLLVDFLYQGCVLEMYFDVLVLWLGMYDVFDEVLCVEFNCYLLKIQGLLGCCCLMLMFFGFWKDDLFSFEEELWLIILLFVDGKLLEILFNLVYCNFDYVL